jgi:hypothetical protein
MRGDWIPGLIGGVGALLVFVMCGFAIKDCSKDIRKTMALQAEAVKKAEVELKAQAPAAQAITDTHCTNVGKYPNWVCVARVWVDDKTSTWQLVEVEQ